MEVYVKPKRRQIIICKKEIYIKDICEVSCLVNIKNQIENQIVKTIPENTKRNYLISVMEIVEAIKSVNKNITVINVGEPEILIEYLPKKPENKKLWLISKIAVVSLILFSGSATAIMAFHNETLIPETLSNYYKIFFGVEKESVLLIDVPYSLGIGIGIITFFNHMSGKKLTADPTPIEVEMSKYESDITDAEIDILSTGDTTKN